MYSCFDGKIQRRKTAILGETHHGIVEDGSHLCDMEVLVHLDRPVLEVLLAPRILDLALSDQVVLIKGLLELCGRDTNLFGQLFTVLEVPHQSTAHVVLAVPLDLLGGRCVQDQADGELVLPHHASNIVAVAELVTEALAVGLKEQTTDTTEGLGSKELDLGIRFAGVNKTSGVDLDHLHVDGLAANSQGHLDTVAGGVITVGSGQVPELGAVLTYIHAKREKDE